MADVRQLRPPEPCAYGFGTFEFQPGTGELRKGGTRIRLQTQLAQALNLLLEQAGEVVTREDFRQRLWAPGTHVDYESSLNTIIRKLRQSLLDDADQPRYIETVPRVGYRMIAPVRRVPSAPRAVSGNLDAVSPPAAVPVPVTQPRNLRTPIALAVTALLAGLTLIVALRPRPDASPMLESRPFSSTPDGENRPALSPDGTVVAFDAAGPGGNHIFLQRADGDQAQQLSAGQGIEQSPAWSPTGDRLAFIRQLPNHIAGIFTIPVPGAGEQKWSELPQWQNDLPHLDWSPDGAQFLSGERDSPAGPSYLVAVSLKTGGKRRLTHPPLDGLGDSLAGYSPDGRTIAFRRGKANGVEDVWMMQAAGGGERRLTFDDRGISGIAWAADGRSLVISSRRTGSLRNLWRLRLPNGPLERLLTAAVDAGGPAVSRRGRRLAYILSVTDIDCWRVAASGGIPERFISSTGIETSPQYSPDGRRVSFVSDRAGSSEIWLANSDGSSPVRITNSGNRGAGGAQWSPDNRYLVFNASPDRHNDVFVVGAEGKQLRRITSEPFVNSAPSWSHDGRWIYYSSNRSGPSLIWRSPAGGGAATVITRAPGGFPLESPDGKFIYYLRGANSCTVLRQRLSGPGSPSQESSAAEETVFDYPGRILGNYTVAESGIYFICVSPGDISELWYYDFSRGDRRRLHVLEKYPASGAAGISLSPDGKWVAYGQVERSTHNIQLVDNFR